jgi:hypothetical protein
MILLLKIISVIGLLLTIVPAFLVFSGTMTIELHYTLMLVGTVLWFGSAPFWMLKKSN